MNHADAMTTRNLGVKFSDLMSLPIEERRRQLLGRLQDIYDTALAKTTLAKAGEFANPDCHTAVKCVEVTARLTYVDEAKQVEQPVEGSASELAKAAFELEQKRKKAA